MESRSGSFGWLRGAARRRESGLPSGSPKESGSLGERLDRAAVLCASASSASSASKAVRHGRDTGDPTDPCRTSIQPLFPRHCLTNRPWNPSATSSRSFSLPSSNPATRPMASRCSRKSGSARGAISRSARSTRRSPASRPKGLVASRVGEPTVRAWRPGQALLHGDARRGSARCERTCSLCAAWRRDSTWGSTRRDERRS